MNQRRQQQRGGGGNQQPQNQQQNQNQQLANQQAAKQLFGEIIRGVEGMRDAIEAVLPVGETFGSFRAILMMALRHNPDIMTCSTTSIITSCMKAAYDGVKLDGVEAALVPSRNKVIDPITEREIFRRDARYNIMFRGMRKQVLRGGLVRDWQTTVVYANEKFAYRRGLDPDLTHEPILDSDKRGPAVGAYAVAWFHDGGRPSFEVMNKAQIEAVRDMAQSGPVWKGPMVDEMWRKTVGRRHRKSLPGANDIIDMEARADFPQFVQTDLTPERAHSGELPAKVQDDTAPQRGDFAQLENVGGESGTPLDFGRSGEMTAEEVEREERGEQQKPQQQAAAVEQARESREPGPVPEGFETWQGWHDAVATRLKTATTLPKLDAVTAEVKGQFDEAPDDLRASLGELYELRAQDHRDAVK